MDLDCLEVDNDSLCGVPSPSPVQHHAQVPERAAQPPLQQPLGGSTALEQSTNIPGPAGLLQTALQAGALPANLADLSRHTLDQKASSLLTTYDASFSQHVWIQAASAAGIDPTFKIVHRLFTQVRQVRSRGHKRAERMLLLLHALHTTACGDAFVTLKDPTGIMKGSMSRACFAVHPGLRVGCALTLTDAPLVSVPGSVAYVCIVPANIVAVHGAAVPGNCASAMALTGPSALTPSISWSASDLLQSTPRGFDSMLMSTSRPSTVSQPRGAGLPLAMGSSEGRSQLHRQLIPEQHSGPLQHLQASAIPGQEPCQDPSKSTDMTCNLPGAPAAACAPATALKPRIAAVREQVAERNVTAASAPHVQPSTQREFSSHQQSPGGCLRRTLQGDHTASQCSLADRIKQLAPPTERSGASGSQAPGLLAGSTAMTHAVQDAGRPGSLCTKRLLPTEQLGVAHTATTSKTRRLLGRLQATPSSVKGPEFAQCAHASGKQAMRGSHSRGRLQAAEFDDDDNAEPSQHATGRAVHSRHRSKLVRGVAGARVGPAQMQALSAAGLGFSQDSL